MKYLLLVIAIMMSHHSMSQPNWTVNSAQFSLDFTIVTELNFNGTYSNNTMDMVAAFDSQGNVRGVGNPVYYSQLDKYLVTLSVLSNTIGDTITFKIYNSVNDSVYDALNSPINFSPNELMGEYSNPYVMSNVNVPSELLLSNASFIDSVQTKTRIGLFSSVFPDNSTSAPQYSMVQGVGDSGNVMFSIVDSSLLTDDTFHYIQDSIYSIRVRVENQGYNLERVFEIKLINSGVVSVKEINTSAIIIYPNPTSGVFYMDGLKNEPLQLTVFDCTGKVVTSKNIEDQRVGVDLSSWPSGVYYVQLISDIDSRVLHLVKK